MSDDEFGNGGGYQRGNKRSRRTDSGMGDGNAPEPGILYLKLLVPHLAVGSIIGKGGEAIIELQKRVGARCRMSKPDDVYPGTSNERICMLTGPEEGVIELVKYVHSKTVEKQDPNPRPDASGRINQSRHKQVKFVVPNTTAGMIIGKGGHYIKEISDTCSVKAIVSSKSESVDGTGGNERSSERIVTVEGEDESVDRACEFIVRKIGEDPNHMSNQDISHWSSSGGGQLSSSQTGNRGSGPHHQQSHSNGGMGGGGMNGSQAASMLSGMMGMGIPQNLLGAAGMSPFGPRGPCMPPGMGAVGGSPFGMPPGMPPNEQAAAMMAAGYGGMLAAFGGGGGGNAGGMDQQLAAAAAAQQQQQQQQQDRMQQHGLQPLLQEKGMMDNDLRQSLAFGDSGSGGGSLSALGASLGVNMSGHGGSGSGGITIGGMTLPRSAAASLEKLRGLLDASRYPPVAQDEIVQALLILAKHNLLPGIGQNNEMITNLLVSLSAVGNLHDIVANLQASASNGSGSGGMNSSMGSGNVGGGQSMGMNESAAAALAAAANSGMFPPGAMGGMAGLGGMGGLLGAANGGGGGGMDSAEMKREMYVEDSLVGVVLGPGGKGLREIGRASGGARVMVSSRGEGAAGNERRMVTLNGTVAQVERAQRFVEELVETERRRRARLAHKRKA